MGILVGEKLKGSRLVSSFVALAILAVCIAGVPVAAYLGLSILYIEPNPRHMPTVLTGEAVGWAIIGLLSGAFIVILTESVMWPSNRSFWDKYRGLIIGAPIALFTGTILGIAFAIVQMDSVDGQAMTSKYLAALAGATAGFFGTIGGIVGGAVSRRFIVSMYRLPSTRLSGRLTFNDEDATGTAGQAAGRS